MATAVQMMALPKYQLEWVAAHLGHTMDIHKNVYRQQIDSVELSKITKLMFLVDHGKMGDVAGLNLDEVDEFLKKDDVFKVVEKDDYRVRFVIPQFVNL